METINGILSKHQSKLKYLYLCGAVIAAINTLSRVDYNFVIYLYMFYVWTFMDNSPEAKRQDKIGTFYLTVFTLLIDFIWALYWGEKWENVPTLFHEMTLFLSWCGIILKIFVILIVGVLEFNIISKSVLPFMVKKDKPQSFQAFEDEGNEKN